MGVEDKLDAASNLLPWRVRVTLELKEYDLSNLVDKVVVPLTFSAVLVAHEKEELKFERVILDSSNSSPIQEEYGQGDV
jgi:hypothetical protein